MKFAYNVEPSEGLQRKSLKIASDEQLEKSLNALFIQQRTSGTSIFAPPL